ncbi:hypothetical protein [uncultured Microbulbifer sp.]|uniref:hypothetical protein n=1 Tax=uncultured Microbulbifer sp. TaxID=348147 RepID=UPI002609AE80|nr:hypothetical protein [uncultured Microbulbifer sp.]
MDLVWTLNQSSTPFGSTTGEGREHEIHYAESTALTNDAIYQDLAASLNLAISLLDKNVNDSSRYFLIHWESQEATLTLSVTDDCKKKDSRAVTCCHFAELEKRMLDTQYSSEEEKQHFLAEFSENLRFWCKEFLSTDQGFSHFSLVALFTDTTRDSAVIL